jgi:dihydroorotate dehydrogenase
MISLETRYLGLTLKNPIIISSSGLTDSVEKIKKLEKAGAGAVVLKSLFEEQIKAEAGDMISSNIENHPDAADYINSYIKDNSLDQYLTLIEEAKKQTQIPILPASTAIRPMNGQILQQKLKALEPMLWNSTYFIYQQIKTLPPPIMKRFILTSPLK